MSVSAEPTHHSSGTVADQGERDTAVALAFLKALEARDLAGAQASLGEGFQMVFPGTHPMTSLADLIAWAAPRYRFVRKTIAASEHMASGPGTVVYVRGTLEGEWPDGRPFAGIRFVDRFEIVAGKIVRQDVWNDLAEVRGQAAGAQ